MNEENLMKTYIYGAGNIALHIIAKMKEYEGEITGFIDSYKKGEYEGYPIVLLEDVEKDSFYFMNSDGGMTLSGGAQYEQHIGNIPKIKTGRNL